MVYFDHAATSPISELALEAYVEVSRNHYGNPESTHAYGRDADHYLQKARTGILSLLGLEKTHDLVFTSGATEANNLAIGSVIDLYRKRGHEVICSPYEHPSVLVTLRRKEEEGAIKLLYPRDEKGAISPKDIEPLLSKETLLCVAMGVNNETGALTDVSGIAALLKSYPKCLYLMDFTQGMGKMRLALNEVPLIAFSSHKFGGPKGVGGLIYRKNLVLRAVVGGGEQEKGLRPGTVDVASCYASYVALKEKYGRLDENPAKVERIRQYIIEGLREESTQIHLNSPLNGSPYILNFSLTKKKAAVVAEALSGEGIYVGTVSACSSKNAKYSYVLKEMGRDLDEAANSLRLSFVSSNTLEEAEAFLKAFKRIIKEVKDRG